MAANDLTKAELIKWTIKAAYDACADGWKQQTPICWTYRQTHDAKTTIFEKTRRENNEPEEFFDTFPQGKILFIVRDPRAIVVSRRDQAIQHHDQSWDGFMGLINFLIDLKKNLLRWRKNHPLLAGL